MDNQKVRQSNFELLRIIAMLFIVTAHYAGHGIFEVSSNSPYNNYLLGGEANRLFTLLLTPGGKTGVAIFFLLAGYFCYKKDTIPNLTRVISQCFVYAFLLAFLAIVFKFTHLFNISNGILITSFLNCLIPFSNGAWWFVTSYICLMIVTPQINTFIKNLNGKGDFILLLLLFVLWNILGVETTYYNLIRAPFYYCFGAIIRKHNISVSKKRYAFLCFIIFVLSWVCYAAITFFYVFHVNDTEILGKIQAKIFNIVRVGFIIPLTSISIFLLFTKFNFINKYINSFAGCMFGVYLFHDSNLLRNVIWSQLIKPVTTHFTLPLQNYIYYSLSTVIIIFITCAIIDFLCNSLIIKFLQKKLFPSVIQKMSFYFGNKPQLENF